MKNIIIESKKAWNDIKSCVSKFYNWKKESYLIWLLKILLFIVMCVLIWLFAKYIFPTLAGIIVLIILYIWDKKPAATVSNNPTVIEERHAWYARDILFRVLISCAVMLDIVKPNSVEDITPVKYFVVQNINRLNFYRFIVRKKPDAKQDYEAMMEILNLKIAQNLEGGYPNISTPFYRGLPYYVVIDVNEDAYHYGCLYIDIMPIIDDGYYNHVMERQRKRIANKEEALSIPTDEDF